MLLGFYRLSGWLNDAIYFYLTLIIQPPHLNFCTLQIPQSFLFQVKRKIKYYRLLWVKYDLPAGLSVFFVALPLCLGIALASGAPLYSGILSGIIGGVVVSFISGSSLAVSGPAAGLTTVVAGSIAILGDFRLFLLAVVIAGLFQIISGVLKLGSIANYFPSS